jgi:hypothetical protein
MFETTSSKIFGPLLLKFHYVNPKYTKKSMPEALHSSYIGPKSWRDVAAITQKLVLKRALRERKTTLVRRKSDSSGKHLVVHLRNSRFFIE